MLNDECRIEESSPPATLDSAFCIPHSVLVAIASRTTGRMFWMCARLAISGTTPRYLAWSSAWVATTLERTSYPSATSAAAVSSQVDSMPRIVGIEDCGAGFPVCTRTFRGCRRSRRAANLQGGACAARCDLSCRLESLHHNPGYCATTGRVVGPVVGAAGAV